MFHVLHVTQDISSLLSIARQTERLGTRDLGCPSAMRLGASQAWAPPHRCEPRERFMFLRGQRFYFLAAVGFIGVCWHLPSQDWERDRKRD